MESHKTEAHSKTKDLELYNLKTWPNLNSIDNKTRTCKLLPLKAVRIQRKEKEEAKTQKRREVFIFLIQ